MKRNVLVWGIQLVVALSMVLSSTVVLAASGPALFIEKCASCHVNGGEAAPVNPADKAAIVWDKYFKRGRHPVALEAKMSDADLEAVIDYLMKHAADSDQPAAAVIPK